MIKNYLTENLLYLFLKQRYAKTIIRQYKIKFNDRTYRVDFFLSNEYTIIEFDGYRHFNCYRNQIRDEIIKNYCKENNIKLIRIPYFIQLDTEAINYFFKDIKLNDYNSFNNYLHGFIDDKALRPYDFNYAGLIIFNDILSKIPANIKVKIKMTYFMNIDGFKYI